MGIVSPDRGMGLGMIVWAASFLGRRPRFDPMI